MQQIKDRARRASPINYASKEAAPMLLVHGDADPLVPCQQSEELCAALKKAGAEAEIYIVKGGGLARFYPRTFNMAISRKAYEATGGFRQMFHGEDIELSYRIRKAGFDLLYEGSAQVYHRRRSTVAQYARQLFAMGRARVTLARLHPGSLEPLHLLPALLVSLLLLFALILLWLPSARHIVMPCAAAGMLFLALLGMDSAWKIRTLSALFIFRSFSSSKGSYGTGFLVSLILPEKIHH